MKSKQQTLPPILIILAGLVGRRQKGLSSMPGNYKSGIKSESDNRG